MPRDHAFVRSSDPHFGSAFGGGCDHFQDHVTCGWPESAHPAQFGEAEAVTAYSWASVNPVAAEDALIDAMEEETR